MGLMAPNLHETKVLLIMIERRVKWCRVEQITTQFDLILFEDSNGFDLSLVGHQS